MLQNLHVKNLALIEETEVTFGEGINILTGETGAGKSLLIGSINLALGAKFEKDMLRRDADSALVELTFFDDSQKVKDKLEEMDLEADEDGMVIITRKLQKGKSICKINGETVTAMLPRGCWQGVMMISDDVYDYALLGTTMAPGYEDSDYEDGTEELLEQYPAFTELIIPLLARPEQER
jgi:DNA repair ATPase RecN